MKNLKIAGVKVTSGELKKSDQLHLKRADAIVGEPVIASMMHGKQEIDKLKTGNEGGLTFRNKRLDFQKGDTLVAYYTED